MSKGTKIQRVLQKLAVMLAIILAFPATPMSQMLGTGITRVYAGETELYAELNVVLSDDKSEANLSVAFFQEYGGDVVIPGGSLSFSYAAFDTVNEAYAATDISPESNVVWNNIVAGCSVSTQYVWTIPEDAKNKFVIVKAEYTGDATYSEGYYIQILSFRAPVVSSLTDIRRSTWEETAPYYFDINLQEQVEQEGTNYYAILTPFNANGYDSVSADEVKTNVEANIESGGNYFIKGDVSLLCDSVHAFFDTFGVENGIYVFQVVVEDRWGNLSNKEVTAPFTIPENLYTTRDIVASCSGEPLVYDGTPQVPTIKATAADQANNERKTSVAAWLLSAENSGKLQYSFFQTHDGDGVAVQEGTVATGSAITGAGTYNIYLSTTDDEVALLPGVYGTLNVSKQPVEDPQNRLRLIYEPSGNGDEYIVTADTSLIANTEGKTLEFSFNGVDYSSENTIKVQLGTTVTAYARFAGDSNISASNPVSASIVVREDYYSQDIMATASTLTYTGKDQVPVVTLKAITDDEDKNTAIEALLVSAMTNEKISFSFKQIKDGIGRAISNAAVAGTVKDVGTYLIYAVSSDPRVRITDDSIGTLKVGKSSEDPVLTDATKYIFDVSEDKKSYIVRVNLSAISNAEGRTLEYSLDGEAFTTENAFVADANSKIAVKVRFVETANTAQSKGVDLGEVTTPAASSKPVITTNVSNGVRMVMITPVSSAGSGADTSGIEIYYTTGGSDFTLAGAKWGLGVATFVLTQDITVKAVAVEPGRILSEVVTQEVSVPSNPNTDPGTENGGEQPNDNTITVQRVTGLEIQNTDSKNVGDTTLLLLDPKNSSINVKAVVSPSTAVNKAVEWKVSTDGVVSLNKTKTTDGEYISIKALKRGKVIVTAYSMEDSGVHGSLTITVEPYTIKDNFRLGQELKFEIPNPEKIKLKAVIQGLSEGVTAKIVGPKKKDPKTYVVITSNPNNAKSFADSYIVWIGEKTDKATIDESNVYAIVNLSALYTITYHPNGAAPVSEDGYTSQKEKELVIPKMDGYEFTGWYYDANFKKTVSSKVVNEKTIYYIPQGSTGKKDVYAKWTAKTLKVTFKSNYEGSEEKDITQDVKNNIEVKLNINKFNRDGYTFAGWTTSAGSNDVIYFDGQKATFTGDQVLYAVWAKKGDKITVTLNCEGGILSEKMQQIWEDGVKEYVYGGELPSLPTSSGITKKNYKFDGWYRADGSKINNLSKVKGNITLTAVWKANKFTVNYKNKTNAELPDTKIKGKTNKTTVYFGETWKPAECGFTVEGYKFVGWTTEKDGKEPNVSATPSVYTYENNITLYAIWEAVPQTLNLYTGVYGELDTSGYYLKLKEADKDKHLYTFTYLCTDKNISKSISLPDSSLVKLMGKDLKFAGWFKVKKNSGGDYTYTPTGKRVTSVKKTDTDLYMAKLSGHYNITYHIGDEKVTESIAFGKKTKLKAIKKFKKISKDTLFAGWAVASGGAVVFKNSQKITIEDLNAKLGKIPENLNYDLYAVLVPKDKTYELKIVDDDGNLLETTTFKYSKGVTKKQLKKIGKKYCEKYGGFLNTAGVKVTSIKKKTAGDQVLIPLEQNTVYKVKLEFNNNSASIGVKINKSKLKSKTIKSTEKNGYVKIGKLTASGYRLIGFSTDPNATVPEYYLTPNGKGMYLYESATHDGEHIAEKYKKSTVTLYAVWEVEHKEDSFTYYFNMGPVEPTDDGMTTPDYEELYNGTKTMEKKDGEIIVTLKDFNQVDNDFVLPTPTRAGYYFTGWQELNNKSALVLTTTAVNGESVRFLYAAWKPIA